MGVRSCFRHFVLPRHVGVNRPLANGAPQAVLFPTHVGLNRANSRDAIPITPATNHILFDLNTRGMDDICPRVPSEGGILEFF
jgi:hypothetical protein